MTRLKVPGLVGLLVAPAAAQSTGREGYGLIGYGIDMYNPTCAYSCRSMAASFMLKCGDDVVGGTAGHHSGAPTTKPSLKCYATNDPFLQTAAWCIHTHCQGVPVSKLERFWEQDIVGRQAVQPSPKYSYQEALAQVKAPPTAISDFEQYLNDTSLIDEDAYIASWNGNYYFELMEVLAERYGIVLMVSCTLIPMALSWARFLPLPQGLISRFYGWFIEPPAFGSYHSTPVLGLGFIPTRGQALFITYIWIVNIFLSAVGYTIADPNDWFSSTQEQAMAFVSNRVGIFSFVNLALSILYASRNSVLLCLTNWSHSTFLLLHRWLAVICMFQAVIHSALYLDMYLKMGGTSYSEAAEKIYWKWGIAATLLLVLLMPLSILPLRRRFYEAFLAGHVFLAAMAMTGCLLHIYYRYQWQWGYQAWVYVAFAIWGFDRFLARPFRLLKSGVKRALVTVVDEDYLRIDVPGADASGQTYLYFPTLTWRVWENHPFSVAAVCHPAGVQAARQSLVSPEPGNPQVEPEKVSKTLNQGPAAVTSMTSMRAWTPAAGAPGIAFYVRRLGGLTASLARQAQTNTNGIPVLVEGSYGTEQMSIYSRTHAKPSVDYPNLICIAGGVGITAALPLLTGAPLFGSMKLFWGVRTEPLVRSVEQLLGVRSISRGGSHTRTGSWGQVDVTISVGPRLNVREVLETELLETKSLGGATVVVCGPPGMADEVRVAVAALARNGAVVRLVQESFSW